MALDFETRAVFSLPPTRIAEQLLVLENWTKFKGESFLPAIVKAEFVERTEGVLGSIIRVKNGDGSTHFEKVTHWDPERLVRLEFYGFASPLRHLAKGFTEEWRFEVRAGGDTLVRRGMRLHPRGLLGSLVLRPVGAAMKKAFARNLLEIGGRAAD